MYKKNFHKNIEKNVYETNKNAIRLAAYCKYIYIIYKITYYVH